VIERHSRPAWLANFRGEPDRGAALQRCTRSAAHTIEVSCGCGKVPVRCEPLLDGCPDLHLVARCDQGMRYVVAATVRLR
jgi:hypothetical protein